MNLAIERPQNFIVTGHLTQGSHCPWVEAPLAHRIPLRMRFTRIHSGVLLERRWRSLEARSSCSFFLSWDWIGTWVESHPRRQNLHVIEFYSGLSLVGLAIVGQSAKRFVGLISRKSLHLHESGSPELDSLCIEGNGVICIRGFETACYEALLNFFKDSPQWKEFRFGGIDSSFRASIEPLLDDSQLVQTDRIDLCPFVDLHSIRSSGKNYLSSRRNHIRSQIRRSLRNLEEIHPLSIRQAQSHQEARVFLDELISLHQAHWTSKGLPGAFSSPQFSAFHRGITRRAFASGTIHLLRISHGENTLGVLYNFAYRGCIYAYQSGFNYSRPEFRPGIISHYLAICHYLSDPRYSRYDFLAGSSRYKRNLSTGAYPIEWCRLRRRSPWLKLESALRALKVRFKRIAS